MLDNIIRHIAKHSFEVFKNGECDPNITKLSNNQIALLIDSPVSTKTLEFNIGGLIKHLSKRPYKYEEKKFRFTVSIGVVHLPEEGSNVDTIMQYARSACEIATQSEGNSYHVNSDADQIPTIVQTPTSEPVADIVEPKDDTDTSNEHEITELHLQETPQPEAPATSEPEPEPKLDIQPPAELKVGSEPVVSLEIEQPTVDDAQPVIEPDKAVELEIAPETPPAPSPDQEKPAAAPAPVAPVQTKPAAPAPTAPVPPPKVDKAPGKKPEPVASPAPKPVQTKPIASAPAPAPVPPLKK